MPKNASSEPGVRNKEQDKRMYAGGSKNFNERTGKYTNTGGKGKTSSEEKKMTMKERMAQLREMRGKKTAAKKTGAKRDNAANLKKLSKANAQDKIKARLEKAKKSSADRAKAARLAKAKKASADRAKKARLERAKKAKMKKPTARKKK